MTTTDVITKRIKYIRKSKRRSMHDCATILGVSRETYHDLEAGTAPLTLPQLELLAIYLGVDPSDFLEEDQNHPLYAAYLDEDIRPQYLSLREKMIRALIAIERTNRNMSLDDLEGATQVSVDKLQAYANGDLPIPLHDLITISKHLEIPLNALYEPVWSTTVTTNTEDAKENWQPEFADVESKEITPDDDRYRVILTALKSLPLQDQVEITKILLGKLRSQ